MIDDRLVTIRVTAEQIAEYGRISGRVVEQRPHQQELRFPSGRRFIAPLALPEQREPGDES